MQLDVSSLVTYVSALATLMTPEGVVALANGAPSQETEDLVRLVNERRLAA